ncbi:MAG: hypothetical protein MI919_04145 [Holophagales bacterium]|nr:hypothetical protein [Holophagales bacterium]
MQLYLHSLTCLRPNDETGEWEGGNDQQDEIRLEIGDNSAWNPRNNTHWPGGGYYDIQLSQSRSINVQVPFPNSGCLRVVLRDKNERWGGEDYIGQALIGSWVPTSSNAIINNGCGGCYLLTYSVL